MIVRQCTAEVNYSCSRAVLITPAILGVLQVENNFDVSIITDHRYGCSVRTTREHGPCSRAVFCKMHCRAMLFAKGPWTRVVRSRKCLRTPVNTVRQQRPCSRVLSTHYTRVHGPRRRAVFTLVNTARDHGYPK